MKKIFLSLLIVCLSFIPCFAKEKIEITHDEAGIYIFKIDTNKYGRKIKPYMPSKVQTPRKVFEDNPFALVVNAGFFDVKTGQSVSRVIIDRKLLSQVDDNLELVEKLKKDERLEKVQRRAELRIYEKDGCDNKIKFDIVLADSDCPKGYVIRHAIQAGPMIYPDMDLEKEGFLIKSEDGMVSFQAVDILKRRERTAIGLKGKYLYIILFTKDNKVDANEMKNYAKKLHLDKMMAFDGGLSTAISTRNLDISSFGKYQRKVKSFLIIEN